MIIQNLFLALVSPRQKGVPFPDSFDAALTVGSVHVLDLQVMTAVSCIVALGGADVILRRSIHGLGMLAAARTSASRG